MPDGNSFRQGTVGRLETAILTHNGVLVPQPEGLPTVEVIFVNPSTGRIHTAIPKVTMFEIEPGRYFFEWRIPIDQPLLVHQVLYRGKIDEDEVIGEDVVTVLPLTPKCLFSPTLLTKIRGGC